MLSVAVLVSSARIPPHGRVNTKCYPIWNKDRSNIDVVWDGSRYHQPWSFTMELEGAEGSIDSYIQKFWCTDTGVVGRYGNGVSANEVPLEFQWIKRPSLNRTLLLEIEVPDGEESAHLTYTSANGPGTILVVGDTLYFYAFRFIGSEVKYGLPYLSSIVFDEYKRGYAVDELWHYGLRGFNILDITGPHHWWSAFTAIYPAGPHSVTVSVEDHKDGKWAIDVPVTVNGTEATREAFVHLSGGVSPSVHTMSREIITVPGYTCQAYYANKSQVCYRLPTPGKYTWGTTNRNVLGMEFNTVMGLKSFLMPSNMWLHKSTTSDGWDFRVLAASGLGSIVSFSGDVMYVVEHRTNYQCTKTREHLVLVAYDISGEPKELASSSSLGCLKAQSFPDENDAEVAYAGTIVKWVGPFTDKFILFAGQSVKSHNYYGPFKMCGEGYHMVNATCVKCRPGTFSHAMSTVCKPCPEGYVSRSGASSCAKCEGDLVANMSHSACITKAEADIELKAADEAESSQKSGGVSASDKIHEL